MKVTEFFVGFGPKLFSFRRGETEYGIKPIPLGAYVRIIGMNNLEEVEPGDEGRTYREKGYWARLRVVAGRPVHEPGHRLRPAVRVLIVGFGTASHTELDGHGRRRRHRRRGRPGMRGGDQRRSASTASRSATFDSTSATIVHANAGKHGRTWSSTATASRSR